MTTVRLRHLSGIGDLPVRLEGVRQRLIQEGVEVWKDQSEGGPAWHCRKADLPDPILEALCQEQWGVQLGDMTDEASEGWCAATDAERQEATRLHGIVVDYEGRIANGETPNAAATALAAAHDCSAQTVKNHWKRVDGEDRGDWPAALLKAKRGPKPKDDHEADTFFSCVCAEMDAGDKTQPLSLAYETAARQFSAAPLSYNQVRYRWNNLPNSLHTSLKEGIRTAVAKATLPVMREKPPFAMAIVTSDSRQFDFSVLFDGDKKPSRAHVTLAVDWHSGKRLEWVITKHEDEAAVKSVAGAVFRSFGVPEHWQLDNGRANEAVTRKSFRGKPKRKRSNDPLSAFDRVDVLAYHAFPYNGRSKPAERTFKEDGKLETGSYVGKKRAYLGNKPGARADGTNGYMTETEVNAWYDDLCRSENAKPGRRGFGMNGRSHDQAFEDGLAIRTMPPRQLTDWQAHMFMLKPVKRTPHRHTGAIVVNGTTYWSEESTKIAGHGEILIFVNDRNFENPATVTDLEGRALIKSVPSVKRVGPLDAAGVKKQARDRKTIRESMAAERDAALSLANAHSYEAGKSPQPSKGTTTPRRPTEKVVSRVFESSVRPSAPDPARPDNTVIGAEVLRQAMLRKRIC